MTEEIFTNGSEYFYFDLYTSGIISISLHFSIVKAGCGSGSRKRKATSGKQPVGQKKHCSEDLSEQNITNLDSHFLGMSHLNCVLNTLMHAKCCSQCQG